MADAPFGWRIARARPSHWFGSAFLGCWRPDRRNGVADRHPGGEHSDEKSAEIWLAHGVLYRGAWRRRRGWNLAPASFHKLDGDVCTPGFGES